MIALNQKLDALNLQVALMRGTISKEDYTAFEAKRRFEEATEARTVYPFFNTIAVTDPVLQETVAELGKTRKEDFDVVYAGAASTVVAYDYNTNDTEGLKPLLQLRDTITQRSIASDFVELPALAGRLRTTEQSGGVPYEANRPGVMYYPLPFYVPAGKRYALTTKAPRLVEQGFSTYIGFRGHFCMLGLRVFPITESKGALVKSQADELKAQIKLIKRQKLTVLITDCVAGVPIETPAHNDDLLIIGFAATHNGGTIEIVDASENSWTPGGAPIGAVATHIENELELSTFRPLLQSQLLRRSSQLKIKTSQTGRLLMLVKTV